MSLEANACLLALQDVCYFGLQSHKGDSCAFIFACQTASGFALDGAVGLYTSYLLASRLQIIGIVYVGSRQ